MVGCAGKEHLITPDKGGIPDEGGTSDDLEQVIKVEHVIKAEYSDEGGVVSYKDLLLRYYKMGCSSSK